MTMQMQTAEMPLFYRLSRRFAALMSRESWFNRFGLVIALSSFLLGFITYILLTNNIALTDHIRGFYSLLGLNIVLLLVLTYVVGWRAWDVWKQRKLQLAGAQMHIQLMKIFSALVTIPVVLVAIFAITFIHFGVQSWFGDNISIAVNESQEIAQAYLKEHQQSIRADMLGMANDMNREAPHLLSDPQLMTEFFQTQSYLRNFSEAVLVDGTGRLLARSGISFSMEFLPDNFADMIKRADKGEVVVFVGGNDDRVRALIKLDNYVDDYLFVGRFLDENVLARVSSTNKAATTYATLKKNQNSLKFNMTLIFIVVALMLLLVAVWASLTLAERIVMPVSKLINAAERVREGDLHARVEVGATDSEINTLSSAFNRMTNQLATQRSDLISANRQLDERRRFTEAVLGGVNAGVIGMDSKGVIQIVNDSACRLLGCDSDKAMGKTLAEICPEMEKIRRVLRSKAGRSVEVPIDVKIANQAEDSHWIVRMTAEGSDENVRGYVATFDDLSQLIDAQRKAAWSDVARRVAHEIKNPLTPIQLSAERLKKRYSKLITEEADREIFETCTDTIIRHVDDIRHMVDEFSAFARLPATTKKMENLVTICQQIIVLFQQAHRNAKFHFNRPENPVMLSADRQQISQALTNLVKNAYEAVEGYPDRQGEVTLSLTQDENNVTLSVSDNGAGLPEELLPRLKDAYVTTKESGTGLGLSIVAKIAEDHNATLEFLNNKPSGAIVRLIFPKGEILNG
jgi:two-component system nitrogen regulation sensor histidine kinase NtrY